MGTNLHCAELRKAITKEINDCGLPISMVYYMMKDLMRELEDVNNAVIAKEREDTYKAVQQQQQSTVTEVVEGEELPE